MTVTIRLFAQLRELVPAAGRELRLEVPEGATVLDLADELGFGYLPCEIMVNNQRAHNAIRVADGDVVSYFPALAGG